MRPSIIVAIAMLPSVASAQITVDCTRVPWIRFCPPTIDTRIPSGDSKLDRAITICDMHREQKPNFTYPETYQWKPGYEMCRKVDAAWSVTKAANDQRAEQRVEDDDRAFLADYAKNLKEQP